MGKFSPFENSSKEFCDLATSALRLKPDPQNENEENSISLQIHTESLPTQS